MPSRFSLLLLALLPAAGRAQETYTLRKKPLGTDNTLSVEIKVHNKFEAQKWSPAGRTIIDLAFNSDDYLHFTIHPLEFTKEGQLTRFARHFTKAVRVQYGQPYEMSFHGGKYLYTVKGGKDDIRDEKGEALAPARGLDLAGQSIPCDPARTDWNELLPTKPVKVGESWPIPPKRWLMDYEVDLARAKAAGTLREVKTRDGKQLGTIDFVIEVPLTGTRHQGRPLPIKDGSVLRYNGTVEMNIDGTQAYHSGRGTLHIIGKARGPDAEGLDTRLDLHLEVEIIERCN